MYLKHENSTKEKIYEIEVNIPPIVTRGNRKAGMVYNHVEKEWQEREIYMRAPRHKDQKWEIPKPPFNYAKEAAKENRKKKSDPMYIDVKLEEWRLTEWDRRINGFWFYNNGVPTYITGLNYWYLTQHTIDGNPPDYRWTDRRWHLLWQYCVEDPLSLGMIESAGRRTGKTEKSISMEVEYGTRTPHAQIGLQSKTDDDAAFVMEKLIKSYINIAPFFKPILDTQGKKVPSSALNFRSKEINDDGTRDGLNTSITYRSSKMDAYDGFKMKRYVRDEAGKVPHQSVFYGWQVLKPTFLVGSKTVVGKALYTTTIEEGGSDAYKALWIGSDPNKRTATGQTETGLYRLFTPAYQNDADFIDEYGNPMEEEAKAHQQKIRDSLMGDSRAYAEYVRKYPWTIKEAFFSINDEAIFDSFKINQQLEVLSYKEEKDWVVSGNFQWEEVDKKVVFVPNENGRFKVHKGVDMNNDLLWNAVDTIGTRPRPMNTLSMVAGSDPFDHKMQDIEDKKRASKGTGYVFHKFDGLNSDLSETFLCQYKSRPRDPDIYYEDMIMMCFFFGCKMMTERNKSGLINYWDRRGYGTWLVKDAKGHRGISAGTENKQWLAEAWDSYIATNCHKIVFSDLLYDLNEFDITDSRKNDCTMGAGWALVTAYRLDKKLLKNDPTDNKPKKGLIHNTNELEFKDLMYF